MTPLPEPPKIVGPHSLEAEQALLGAILFDNTAYDRLTVRLQPDDFAEPFHGRLWEAVERAVQRGKGIMADLLLTQFADDPALADLGG